MCSSVLPPADAERLRAIVNVFFDHSAPNAVIAAITLARLVHPTLTLRDAHHAVETVREERNAAARARAEADTAIGVELLRQHYPTACIRLWAAVPPDGEVVALYQRLSEMPEPEANDQLRRVGLDAFRPVLGSGTRVWVVVCRTPTPYPRHRQVFGVFVEQWDAEAFQREQHPLADVYAVQLSALLPGKDQVYAPLC